jgi:hypothetical protein
MAVNREVIAQAETWDRSDRVVLDMDSSESPVHGQQEGSAYNGLRLADRESVVGDHLGEERTQGGRGVRKRGVRKNVGGVVPAATIRPNRWVLRYKT